MACGVANGNKHRPSIRQSSAYVVNLRYKVWCDGMRNIVISIHRKYDIQGDVQMVWEISTLAYYDTEDKVQMVWEILPVPYYDIQDSVQMVWDILPLAYYNIQSNVQMVWEIFPVAHIVNLLYTGWCSDGMKNIDISILWYTG
jgi:hypothetical protein